MIVFDASAVVELLTNGPAAAEIRQQFYGSGEKVVAPHLIDIEVISALRRLAASGRLDVRRCGELLSALVELPIERHTHTSVIHRVWELRHNFTAYDACYIVLAEMMGAVLYTRDAKLRKGHRARVVVFGE